MKIFQSESGPTRGRIVRLGTSVAILKFLYACSVFCSNLVSYLSQY